MRAGRTQSTSRSYDALLSYSHAADGKLAPAIQAGLQSLAKPWYVRRALRVFRDETSLAATPELWASIELALERSAAFVLMASPEGAASPWVDREAAWWREHRGSDTILIALTGGELTWVPVTGDFADPSPLPPALRGAFAAEPLWVDLRWAQEERDVSLRNPRFRSAIADLAAPLRGVPKDELIGEDIAQHRRAMRIARAGAAGLAALTVAAAAGAFVALDQRNEARDQTRIAQERERTARARSLAAQAEGAAGRRIDQALLLAAESYRLQETIEARVALIGAIRRAGARRAILTGVDASSAVAASGDGTTLMARDSSSALRLWDLDRGGAGKAIPMSVFSAPAVNGDALAVVDADGEAAVWNLERRERIGRPVTVTDEAALAVTADGRTLATAAFGGALRLWDVTAGRPRATLFEGGRVDRLAMSADGRYLVAGQLTPNAASPTPPTLAWDLHRARREPVALAVPETVARGGAELSVGANGLFVMAAADGRMIVWNLRRRRPRPMPLRLHRADLGQASRVAVAADATRVAFEDVDGEVIVWDFLLRRRLARFSLRRQAAIAFASDGATLAAGGRTSADLWDVSAPGFSRPALRYDGAGLAFSPDERLLAVGRSDGSVDIRDARSGDTLQRLDAPWMRGRSFATFHAGGTGLTSVSVDAPGGWPQPATIVVATWNLDTGRATRVLTRRTQAFSAMSEDGTIVVLEEPSAGKRASIWDAVRGRRLGVVEREIQIRSTTALSPDGRRLAIGDVNNVKIYDARSAREIGATPEGFVTAFGWEPNGKRLFVAVEDDIRAWDVEGRHWSGATVRGVPASSIAVSPDGRTLAVGSGRTLRLIDIASGRALTRPLPVRADSWFMFGRRSASLLSGGAAGTQVVRWDPVLWSADGELLLRRACAIARRDLSRDEWAQAQPGIPYRSTCSGSRDR